MPGRQLHNLPVPEAGGVLLATGFIVAGNGHFRTFEGIRALIRPPLSGRNFTVEAQSSLSNDYDSCTDAY